MNTKKHVLILAIGMAASLPVLGQTSMPQRAYSLKQCLDFALENNNTLKKDRLKLISSVQDKQEVVGSLLPQINASGGLTRNIQKTTIAMPNFVNSMMPPAMQDPNAPKYMTVTMGMDYAANWGAGLTQQIVNLALFNAVSIAKVAGEMAELGVKMTENDVIAQTASLYYGIQTLAYAVEQFEESVSLLDRTLSIVEANKAIGLTRQVDIDRIRVSKANLETQKNGMEQALNIQKNLLKLQMGFPMAEELQIRRIDVDQMENLLQSVTQPSLDVTVLLPYKMMKVRQTMLDKQHKAAVYETLPVITLGANYSMNYMGDRFHGETFHHFPVSLISLNLRMPLFSGLSRSAKIKKAKIELLMSDEDERNLAQTLVMSHDNALRQLEQQLRTIGSQKCNKALAEEVYHLTESNFNNGLSSLSDVLNASSSLIQARMSYVNALGEGMKAYIDLKKAVGTINDLNQ